MLAERIDAVVGVDTHRDTHHAEIALPTGTPIAIRTITNDSTGHGELLAWIIEHTPGPRGRLDRRDPQLRRRTRPRGRSDRDGCP